MSDHITYTIDGTPFTLTVRQSLALYMHYEVGMSKRSVGRQLGVDDRTIRRDINAALDSIAGSMPVECRTLHILVEACFSTWCASEQRKPRGGAQRRYDLAESLEAFVAAHDAETAETLELMGAEVITPTSVTRNHWDHWELRWLAAHPDAESIPDPDPDPKHSSPYLSANAGRYSSAPCSPVETRQA